MKLKELRERVNNPALNEDAEMYFCLDDSEHDLELDCRLEDPEVYAQTRTGVRGELIFFCLKPVMTY